MTSGGYKMRSREKGQRRRCVSLCEFDVLHLLLRPVLRPDGARYIRIRAVHVNHGMDLRESK